MKAPRTKLLWPRVFTDRNGVSAPGEMISALGGMIPPSAEMIPALGEMISPTGEMIPPLGEMIPPLGEMIPPPGEMIPPPGETIPPLGEMISPTGEMIPASAKTGFFVQKMAPGSENRAVECVKTLKWSGLSQKLPFWRFLTIYPPIPGASRCAPTLGWRMERRGCSTGRLERVT